MLARSIAFWLFCYSLVCTRWLVSMDSWSRVLWTNKSLGNQRSVTCTYSDKRSSATAANGPGGSNLSGTGPPTLLQHRIRTKLYCSIAVYSIITRGFMPLPSLSSASSADFPRSWSSLPKCLLPAHLAPQGEQITLAYAAVTGWPP